MAGKMQSRHTLENLYDRKLRKLKKNIEKAINHVERVRDEKRDNLKKVNVQIEICRIFKDQTKLESPPTLDEMLEKKAEIEADIAQYDADIEGFKERLGMIKNASFYLAIKHQTLLDLLESPLSGQ